MTSSDNVSSDEMQLGGDAERLELLAAILGRLRIIDREVYRHSVITEKLLGIKTTELLFLQFVFRQPGLRLSDVAQGLSIHQSTSSNLKRALVSRGLIVETMNPEDRRVSFISLSPKGLELLETAAVNLRSPLRTTTEATPLEMLRQLDELLGVITSGIESVYASGEASPEVD